MVRDALKLVELKAKEKNVKLIMEADDGIPTDIYSDPSRLRQILLNFMSNSVKFSKNDSTLTVEMKMEEVEGQKSIKFAVCDKVIGIPYESIGKVFLPFQQADNSTTREYGGTGLGLPICVYLSTILQGFVHVDSTVDKGSAFSCVIPCIVSQQEGDDAVDVFEKLEGDELALLRNQRFLLYDTSNISLKMITSILFNFKCSEVETCVTQEEANGMVFTAFQDAPFTVLLMHCEPDECKDLMREICLEPTVRKSLLVMTIVRDTNDDDVRSMLKYQQSDISYQKPVKRIKEDYMHLDQHQEFSSIPNCVLMKARSGRHLYGDGTEIPEARSTESK
eukprot:903511_1